MKFAEICTKNVLGHNKTENKFSEMMAKSLDIQKNRERVNFLQLFSSGT